MTHMQLFFAVDAEQALVIDLMALTPQEHMQPPIAEPAPGFSQFFQSCLQHRVILADNFIAHGHPATADHPARPPLAHPVACHQMRDRLPLRGGIVEHGIGKKPFQTGVLVLKAFQSFRLADVHAAILGFPFIDGRIADAVLAAQIGDGNTRLVLFQNADDLVFGKSAAFHLWSFRWGQSLPQTGLGAGGNVTGYSLCSQAASRSMPSRYRRDSTAFCSLTDMLAMTDRHAPRARAAR